MTFETSIHLPDIQRLETQHVLGTYRRVPIVLVRGEGAFVYDQDDRQYLDLVSGVGVASLGHANPGLAAVIAEQAATLLHCSNLYYHPLQGRLAERLASLSGLSHTFFCNSGAEAIEGCLKFARRYWYTKGDTTRTRLVALEHAFHGRTLGALSATWDEHYRRPFEPLIPGVTFVPAGDPAALAAAIDDRTAAVILEPIQGEGGVRPLSQASADAIQEACDRTHALLLADEIQSGLGRTGRPFYFQALGLRPDLLALGKALGAGVPIGAAMLSADVAGTIVAGDHGSTYGGNLLACRAALYFLDQLEGGVLEHVRRVGAHLDRRLHELSNRHPTLIREVRGAGLMRGIVLDRDAAPVVEAALAGGLLVNRTNTNVVRLLPPLTVAETELDLGLGRLDTALATVANGVGA